MEDAAGQVTDYEYDAANRLSRVTRGGSQLAGYRWRADGLLEEVTYGNGVRRGYGFDGADRLATVTNVGSGWSEGFEYGYDAGGCSGAGRWA